MIVLNEKEYAQDCIKNKTLGKKPFFTLTILAKYYYYCFGYRKKKITEILIDFMSKYYPRYDCNKASWDENIEKIASKVGKYTLYEIDGVWITEAELSTIKSLHNKVLERLAFTMLCLAKFSNLRNPKNNGWVNYDAKTIFTLARIQCSVNSRYERLGQLYHLSMLELPKRNDNLSSRVTYINDDSQKVLFISDFRELGYEYLKYKGEQFTNCCECGILMRNNKRGTKRYCSSCAYYTPLRFKTIVCVDCGEEFEVDSLNNRSCRCPKCYDIYRLNRKMETQRIRRENARLKSEQILD